MSELTLQDKKDIEDILRRIANEIASFRRLLQQLQHFGSVELALTREIFEIRELAAKINHTICEVMK